MIHHQWISLEILTIDYNLPLTQLLPLMQISKPRSHSGTLFNFSPKIVPEWLLGSKIKFLKGAILVHTFEREGAILPEWHSGTQEPFWYSLFFGGSADFEINFWHSKRKLMAFSCLILFSSVPPQCVMLWWSQGFFSRHYRDVKLYHYGSCLKWGP